MAVVPGGVPEWLIGTVSKTVVRLSAYRGFESHPLRHLGHLTDGGLVAPLILRLSKDAEGCQSGRMGTPGKRVYPSGYRGFESHPLRHFGEQLDS